MGQCLSSGTTEIQINNSNSNSNRHNKDDKEAQRRACKRELAIQELIETEKTYVNGLNLCIENYYKPLSQNGKIISNDDLRGMFNDIETIYKLNCTFLKDLESNTKNIGDQFVKFCPYFRMYQNYCNNYDEAMVLLNKYSSKQSFTTYCKEVMDECNGQTLQSMLILPIQRLPRYQLCLTEIVKNTENGHSDMIDLRRALELVKETTTLINDRMKEYEARQQVRSIERRFGSIKLVEPHRKFIKEGIMTKIDKTGKGRDYTFFLFNDMLCYASGKRQSVENVEVHTNLSMRTMLPIDRAFFIQDIKYCDKYSDRSFEIHSSVKSFIVHCTEYQYKHQWMESLRKVIKDRVQLQPGKSQQRELAAPLMVPDDWSDKCQMKYCEVKFTFINRRHHCRYCGKLICGKCGKYKLTSRMDKNRFVKPVCKLCFNSYHGTNGMDDQSAIIIQRSDNFNIE